MQGMQTDTVHNQQQQEQHGHSPTQLQLQELGTLQESLPGDEGVALRAVWRADKGVLQCGQQLVRVQRHHPVIMVPCAWQAQAASPELLTSYCTCAQDWDRHVIHDLPHHPCSCRCARLVRLWRRHCAEQQRTHPLCKLGRCITSMVQPRMAR